MAILPLECTVSKSAAADAASWAQYIMVGALTVESHPECLTRMEKLKNWISLEPHRLFSGTLVHGVLRCLKGGWSVESLLPVGSLSGQLCFCLLDAVKDCSFKANPSCTKSGKKRGRGRGRRGRGGRGQSQGGGGVSEEINNRFALLMSEEEYDD